MKYGLSDHQIDEITHILAGYPAIEEAILFGSSAIDTYKKASDVDIAIKGEKVDSALAATLQDHFEEETYLPFFFDVIAYKTITSEELKQHILDKGIVLYKNDPKVLQSMIKIIKNYVSLKIASHYYMKAIINE